MKKVFLIVLILGSLTSSAQNVTSINVSAIRAWLGLGAASTLNSSDVLQPSNNLSDLLDAAAARANLGVSTTANISSSTNKNFVSDAQLTVLGATSGTNTGDNAANSNYASDYRAANFVAGTNYVAPGGALGTPSSGNLANCTFPQLNQNTTGSAAKLTTARTIDGNSFDGTANVGFSKVTVTPSDVTNSTTTMADITGLVTGTLSNSTYYEFEITIAANSSTTAGGTYQVVLGGSGSGSIVALAVTATTGTATASVQNIAASATPTGSIITINGEGVVLMKGFIKTLSAGTATVKVQQAKTTSGNLIARVGSYMKYRAM